MRKVLITSLVIIFFLVLVSGCSNYKYDTNKCFKNPLDFNSNLEAVKCVQKIEDKRIKDMEKSDNPLIQQCKPYNYSEECIYNKAVDNLDLNLCKVLTPFHYHSCIVNIAKLNKDIKICDKYIPENLKSSTRCFEWVNTCKNSFNNPDCKPNPYYDLDTNENIALNDVKE